MNFLRDYLRRYRNRRHVRLWGMIGPILVLVLCLPLLRPLRHPTPREVSQDEAARLATVQAIVEQRTLSVQDIPNFHTNRVIRGTDGRLYVDQPPVLATLLAGAYFILARIGYTFAHSPILTPYLLTLIGVTLPVVVAAALLYRMGRLFELPRPMRSLLAVTCVVAGGLVSYATVLNAHAPAAALVLCAAGCLIHLSTSPHPSRGGGWLVLAGLAASFAAVIDSGAAIFMVLLAIVILAMRWRIPVRLGGVLLYVIGCAPAILLHAVLVIPITGDLRMGRTAHPELAVGVERLASETYLPDRADRAVDFAVDPRDAYDDDAMNDPFWLSVGQGLARFLAALLGPHGLFTHFPIVILGMIGVAAVVHRHWPAPTKTLAIVTAAGALAIVIFFASMRDDPQEPMFAARRFIVFLPLLLFWCGAWLRRQHHAVAWSVAGVLLAFSVAVSLVGATFPFPRDGYDGYSVTAAARQLVGPRHATNPARQAFAGG